MPGNRARAITFTRAEQDEVKAASENGFKLKSLLDKMNKARDPEPKAEKWPFKAQQAIDIARDTCGDRLVLPMLMPQAFFGRVQRMLEGNKIQEDTFRIACDHAFDSWQGDIFFETLLKQTVNLATRAKRQAEKPKKGISFFEESEPEDFPPGLWDSTPDSEVFELDNLALDKE